MNTYSLFTLPNGLPVILAPTPGTSISIFAYVRFGSRYEQARDAGLAHFIEHLHFKGTKQRPTYAEINRDFDDLGADYNAFTGKEETGYYIKCAADRTADAIELLADILFHSQFPEEEFEREKQVIMEEIKMYDDNPRLRLPHVLDAAVFGSHVLGRSVAGTVQSVTKLSRARLFSAHRQFYHPKNMVLAVAGQMQPARVRKLLKKYFGNTAGACAYTRVPLTPFTRFHARIEAKHMTSDQMNLGLSFPGLGDRAPAQHRSALAVLSHILGGGMSSRLFTELREKRGLCYSVGSSLDVYQDVGTCQVFVGLDQRKVSEVLAITFTEIHALVQKGVSEEELVRAKKNLRGRFLLSLEDTADVARAYAGSFLARGKVETPRDTLLRLERVTVQDVHRIARSLFRFPEMSLALVGPISNSVSARRLVARVLSSIKQSPV